VRELLKETLEMVIERMKKHRFLYEQNEMAVRSQIIEPILRGLRWDTENPEQVQAKCLY
jgi:predicted type IV restriction endonuclease